ncbi:DUF4097 family beta strand repeat-containing protein [Mediterraneibacter glycyrrhizinilyticus]|uniref:DUF4097 family beta strand repeat-containing protein n=1 Tax=Mediterraneibacter glycyrrhizinilyticus TaxID=342942 RepID=UPI0025A33E81|nr:DUF4097 family beta strand repeat-containing protein [Mediterraneibacter glycyrrhizinilyticus]MDM8124315.1 DUF4097 family beta strand repeat-containing protein [Mediterraneibacter glycyrrhizinilyticus]
MKKGWKVFWIVCAVMAAAGIVMTAAGIALGGAAMLSSADESGPVHEWLQRTGRIVTENTAPGEPDGDMITVYEGIDEISMDLSGLGVIAEPTDGDDVIIDTSQLRADIREALVITQDGGKLEMETDSHRGFGRNASDPGMLYISLPQGAYYNSFSADVGAGFLEMRGISAGEISLDVGAGQIIAEGFYADVLEADCGAGQITLQGEVVENADLNCDIGEVLFTLPGEMEVYNYELSCSAGELIVGDEAYSGLRNKMKIDNGSSCLIEAECRIGRMEIMFE